MEENKPDPGSRDLPPPTPEFDDPQYIPISAVPLLYLPCKTAGIYVSLYAKKPSGVQKNGLNTECEL